MGGRIVQLEVQLYCHEGGLYAELIQNRGFEECRLPHGCKLDSGDTNSWGFEKIKIE
jgi:hypothetical protein